MIRPVLVLMLGLAGQISLGQAAFFGIGAYLTSNLVTKLGVEPVLAIVVAALGAMLLGWAISRPLSRLHDHYLAMATLAFGTVMYIGFANARDWTGGLDPGMSVPKFTVFGYDMSSMNALFVVSWIALTLSVFVANNIFGHRIGRTLRAMKMSAPAAASVGIDVKRMRWIGWTLSCAMSAVGGALWAYFIVQFTPNNFYVHETFLIVAMLVIGGAASVSGAVVGAIVVALSSEFLRQTETWLNTQRNDGTTIGSLLPFQLIGFTEIVLAIVMILVLITRPSGLLAGRELRWPRGAPQAGVTDLAEGIDEA